MRIFVGELAPVHIEIQYDCRVCGVGFRPFVMRERRADEDVIAWTKYAAECCGAHHLHVAPGCPCREVDLKIPISGADRIGGAPRQ